MKNFAKMTLATVLGLLIFGILSLFLTISMVGAFAAIGNTAPVMPDKAVLTIDMSSMVLAEQTKEADPFAALNGTGGTVPASVGILSAVNAINKAAEDPAVSFIYMKPDAAAGGFAQIEEFRTALKNFRLSGKAVVSYIENPTNFGYYLASVSDKIYMTSYDGGMNMFSGVSSQMFFLKDLLDRMGVNVQLIRHGKYKSAGETFVRSSSSKENMEQNQEMIDSIWESMAREIASDRGITMEQLDSMLDNLELVFPSDFLRLSLVDELMTPEQMKMKLCDLYVASDPKDVKSISLQDYAKLNTAIHLNPTGKIAVVYAEGNIVEGNGRQQVAGDRFARIISDIRKDTTIKAVVLRVNSPGGSVLAAEKIKGEIDLLRESVPVIASFGDYAASGGYWISANCDKIFTDMTSLTGSIGVFSLIPDFSGTLDRKLHINVTPVNSNAHSDIYSMIRPLDAKEMGYMQATVERIYERFTSVVSQGRDMSVEDVDRIGQGRVWTGAEAVNNGLADAVGSLSDAIEYAALSIDPSLTAKDVVIEEYPKPQTTAEMLLEAFGAGSTTEAFMGLDLTSSGRVYARMPYEFDIR